MLPVVPTSFLETHIPFWENKRSLLDLIETEPTESELEKTLPKQDLSKEKQCEAIQSTFLKVQALLNIFREAFTALKKGEIHKFDPCVGDSGCFVRSMMFVELSHYLQNQQALEKTLKKLDTVEKAFQADKVKNEKTIQNWKVTQELQGLIVNSSVLPEGLRDFLESACIETEKATATARESTLNTVEKTLLINEEATRRLKGTTPSQKKKKLSFNHHFENLNVKTEDLELETCLIITGFAYFLWKSKVERASPKTQMHGIAGESTNPLLCKKLTSLSDTQLINLDKIARKYLAAFSISYLHHIGNRIPLTLEIKELNQLISSPHIKKDPTNNRLSVPCFASTDLLIRYAQQNRFSFVLNCLNTEGKQVKALYTPSEKGYTIQELTRRAQLDMPVIVMKGRSTMNPPLKYEELTKMNLWELLLENDAVHPQYPLEDTISWPKDSSLKSTQNRFEMYKKNGEDGCSSTNPTRLFIEHFYPDTLLNQTASLSY